MLTGLFRRLVGVLANTVAGLAVVKKLLFPRSFGISLNSQQPKLEKKTIQPIHAARMIKWTDPKCQVTDNFTVHDCLWLGQWGRLANEKDGLSEEICEKLIIACENAEKIRSILSCKMLISSMYRPPQYSPLVGGSSTDVHTQGIAFDFVPNTILSVEAAKELIRPNLDSLNLRMEKGTTTWIHIDSKAPGPSGREFIP
jgi:Peptidase M15